MNVLRQSFLGWMVMYMFVQGAGWGDTPISVTINSASSGTAVTNAVLRLEPGTRLFSANDAGHYTVRAPGAGLYWLYITAQGFAPRQLLIPVTLNSLQLEYSIVLSPSAAPSADSDGDGIVDSVEEMLGTDPDLADTDGDGMSDLFEVEYGLAPNDPSDAGLDPDDDRLTNLDEYQARANPMDTQDPFATVFVSAREGSDRFGDGSLAHPYATIAVGQTSALAQAAAGQNANVVLLPGVYEEDVVLEDGVRLSGIRKEDDTYSLEIDLNGPRPFIHGQVLPGQNCVLMNLNIIETLGKQALTPMMVADQAGIQCRAVRFLGTATSSSALGILFTGDAVRNALVTHCRFWGLNTGIEVRDAIPRIRRTQFLNLAESGVILRQRTTPPDFEEHDLGNENVAWTGWNLFKDIGGFAVVNERDVVKMQLNEWESDLPEVIENEVGGEAVVVPFLFNGNAILASSIACTVRDAQTRAPVTNATIRLVGTNFMPATDNVGGVYVFAALVMGNYTVEVEAPDYENPVSRVVMLGGGEQASLVIAMGAAKAGGEGEGEGEGEKPAGAGCGAADAAPGGMPELASVFGAMAAGLALSRRRRNSA